MTATMTTLLERITAAEAGSRELDAEIAIASGKYVEGRGRDGMLASADTPNQFGYGCPAYTTSIDAALSLVPEGWAWAAEISDYNYAYVWLDVPEYDGHPCEGHASTPALAICAAALQAREQS